VTLFIPENLPPVKTAAPGTKGRKNRKNQLTDAQSLPYVSRNITKKKGGTMVPEEIIGADTSIQPFLSAVGPEGYMNIQGDSDAGVLALRPVAGWDMPDTPEPAGWLNSGGLFFDAGEGSLETPGLGREVLPFPGLVFGEDDEDDDIEDDEDGFDDMEDDFEDDFEDEDDDDFEDEDFEDEDDDDDYDYDEDGDFDDDFEE
jgi:hypothetical protein